MKHLHNDQIGAEKCVCDYQGGSLTLWSILDYLDYDKVVYIIQVFIPYEAANIIAMDGTAVWTDMLAETTINKTGWSEIFPIINGHKKVSVFL